MARRAISRPPICEPTFDASSATAAPRRRRRPRTSGTDRGAWRSVSVGAVALLLIGAGIWWFSTAHPVTSPSEYTQITNFTDSATAPSLSPDGRLVTFIRGGEAFLSRGEIYVKLPPNGESVQPNRDGRAQ